MFLIFFYSYNWKLRDDITVEVGIIYHQNHIVNPKNLWKLMLKIHEGVIMVKNYNKNGFRS